MLIDIEPPDAETLRGVLPRLVHTLSGKRAALKRTGFREDAVVLDREIDSLRRLREKLGVER